MREQRKYQCSECGEIRKSRTYAQSYPTFCDATQKGAIMTCLENPEPTTTFWIGKNRIEIWEQTQTVRTTFPDGSQLVAAPQLTDDYWNRAKEAGYGSCWEYCKSHEILHTAIAVGQGKEYSRGLWRAANKIGADTDDFEEENHVLKTQNKNR